MQEMGIFLIKLEVPSIGSIIQVGAFVSSGMDLLDDDSSSPMNLNKTVDVDGYIEMVRQY